MWIIYEPNGHGFGINCGACGAYFNLGDPQPVAYVDDGGRLGDLCPDCASAAESRGAVGIADEMRESAEHWRKVAHSLERRAQALAEQETQCTVYRNDNWNMETQVKNYDADNGCCRG